MNFCYICGSTGAIKCSRCQNYACLRHSVQLGPEEIVCRRCARLAAEEKHEKD